jgi:hypothetical protein
VAAGFPSQQLGTKDVRLVSPLLVQSADFLQVIIWIGIAAEPCQRVEDGNVMPDVLLIKQAHGLSRFVREFQKGSCCIANGGKGFILRHSRLADGCVKS